MSLEDRLERLASRTPPGDPADVMAGARARAESRPGTRDPRFLVAAAAVVAVLALAAGVLALRGGDDSDSVTVAGPDGTPTRPQPSCEDITRFADSLDDTGIDYDYSGSSSPQDLAERSGVVFAGTLTGTVTQTTGREYIKYVGFEVQVTDRFKTDEERESDTVTVLLEISGQLSTDHWADLVPPGAPVIVFADRPAGSPREPGASVVANPVEGIVTACEGGPPVGLVGNQDEWPSLATLADIELALRSPAPTGTAAGDELADWGLILPALPERFRAWREPVVDEVSPGIDHVYQEYRDLDAVQSVILAVTIGRPIESMLVGGEGEPSREPGHRPVQGMSTYTVDLPNGQRELGLAVDPTTMVWLVGTGLSWDELYALADQVQVAEGVGR